MPEPKLKEKRWNREHEKEIFQRWKKMNLYAKPTSKGRIFVIDTPPPYPSGRWHMGGAIHYSQIDMIARFLRMKGKPVWFPLGIDRNGLPIENRVEKDYNIRAHEVPREKFLDLCRKKLDEYEKNILSIMEMLGLSVDWREPYRTDSEEYRALTQATFIELWRRGLIYEAERPNNWCPGCRTTLADAEIEYKTEKTKLVYIRFPLADGGEIVIATTRPELLGACRAILVHPADHRYKKLHGKKAVVPIYGHEVEIIAHKEADPEFGTGAMMVCSFGDQTDIRLFRELKLKPTILINPDGTMNSKAGKYAGLKVKEARERIVKDLEKEGFVEKIEIIDHKVPICWRSKDEIEFIALPELYLKQEKFVEEIKKIVDEMEFHPPWMKQLLVDWIESIKQDWPISRRRFYGTPVPVFYCPEHGAWVPEPGPYYESWKMELPCPKCGKLSRGDERVLDTWMDSSISPLWVSHWRRDEKFFSRAFPVFLRPQGKDIIRTWLYYSLLRVYQLTGEKAFEHVWISGHVVDAEGRKMSKSLGNVIYPEPLIEKYGGDAVRFQGAAEARLGSDIRVSEEKIAGASKFIQKLYNVARFVSMFEPVEKPQKLKPTDRWILSELGKVIEKAMKGYENFDFFIPANEVRNFVWDLFAPHYIEMVKHRAYEGDESAVWTLHEVLKAVLKLLAPITPFVTDYIWHELYGGSIHEQLMPEPLLKEKHPTQAIVSFNEEVWREKKERGMSLKEPIKKKIPDELKPYQEDLVAMHNIQQ